MSNIRNQNAFFFLSYFFLPCFILLGMGRNASLHAEVEMLLGVDRALIYEGESFAYQIALTDSQQIPDSIAPDLSAFVRDFQVKALPKQTSSNSSFQMGTGRQIRRETISSTIYTYELTPKKSGDLTIPAPMVLVDGKRLRPKTVKIGRETLRNPGEGSISVSVRGPDKQDIVFLTVETDRERLYPLQSLIVSLVVQVKALPENLTQNDPLSVLGSPPQLTIPWLDDRNLPKGLVPDQPLDVWASKYTTPQTQQGFSINGFASRGLGFDDDFFNDPFSMRRNMFERRLLQFRPKPKKINRHDEAGNEAIYYEYRFERAFKTEELGDFIFGPVILKGVFAVADAKAEQGAVPRTIYAVAPAVSVEVVDVPEENRPDNYIGAFGQFDWTVDILPKNARIGDPMTATLRLSGKGSTLNIKPPDLAMIPEIAKSFKTIFPPSEETDKNSCTLTYSIRPLKSGTVVFPSIPISFFDVDQQRFVEVRSAPVSLEIEEAAGVRPLVQMGNRPFSGQLERSERGLFANMIDPSGAVDRSVNYPRLFGLALGLLVAYALCAATVGVWKLWNTDPRRRRQVGALSRARNRLGELRREIRSANNTVNPAAGQAGSFGVSLQSILYDYIADKTGSDGRGMTTKDACEKLAATGLVPNDLDEIRRLLETLDAARYGGFDLQSLDKQIDVAEKFLHRVF